MSTKFISLQEAMDMVKTKSEILPICIINTTGKAVIINWVNRTAKHPDRHNMEAWYLDAEMTFTNSSFAHSAILVMHRILAINDNTETLTLKNEYFDWTVSE